MYFRVDSLNKEGDMDGAAEAVYEFVTTVVERDAGAREVAEA